MANLTWHVWQIQLTKPDEITQYAAPEDGETRPDVSAWTDDYPIAVRGQVVNLAHVGTVQHPAMGAYGADPVMADALAALAPADVPLTSSVAVTFLDPTNGQTPVNDESDPGDDSTPVLDLSLDSGDTDVPVAPLPDPSVSVAVS